MITNGIIKALNTRDDWRDFFNSHSTSRNYLESTNISVSAYDFSKIVLGDLTNAFKRGKVCAFYTLSGSEPDQLYRVLEKYNYDPQAVIDACHQLEFESLYSEMNFEGLMVSKSEEKGVNTFSPLLLDRLNPLKEIPKKWTINHVIRMLANDQFENLRTRSRYTDDYAYDAAYNFGAGSYDRDTMIKELVESSSGWWVSGVTEDGGELGINCHHFDYKGCTVRLNGAEEKPAPEADEEHLVVAHIQRADEESEDSKVASLSQDEPLRPAGILMH